jgi:hypothetical protein
MKAKSILTFLCFLLAMYTPLTLLGSTHKRIIPTNSGELKRENPAAMESEPIAGVLADESRKRELLAYAKKVFLARLGFAVSPVPPCFLERVQRSCFVTFFSGKKVIACFGGFYPRKGNLAGEIEENVGLALRFDLRARSIDRKTALSAEVQVTFPGPPESVNSYLQVNPLYEGLLVENDHGGVAIVPGEAKTSSWAFRDAMRRLGEKDPARVRLSRFRAFAVSSGNAGKR